MMRSFLTQGRRSSVASRRHFCSNNGLDDNAETRKMMIALSKIPVKAIIFRHYFDRFLATSAGYVIGYTFIKPRAKKIDEEYWQEVRDLVAKKEAMLAKMEEERVEREARSSVRN